MSNTSGSRRTSLRSCAQSRSALFSVVTPTGSGQATPEPLLSPGKRAPFHSSSSSGGGATAAQPRPYSGTPSHGCTSNFSYSRAGEGSPTHRRSKPAASVEPSGMRAPSEPYLTPLQQKEVAIRHLRAKLKDSQRLMQEREGEMEELRLKLGQMQEDWVEEEYQRLEAQLSLKEAKKEIKQLKSVIDTMKNMLVDKEPDGGKGVQKYFIDINIQNKKLEALLKRQEAAENGVAGEGQEEGSSPPESATRSSAFTKGSEDEGESSDGVDTDTDAEAEKGTLEKHATKENGATVDACNDNVRPGISRDTSKDCLSLMLSDSKPPTLSIHVQSAEGLPKTQSQHSLLKLIIASPVEENVLTFSQVDVDRVRRISKEEGVQTDEVTGENAPDPRVLKSQASSPILSQLHKWSQANASSIADGERAEDELRESAIELLQFQCNREMRKSLSSLTSEERGSLDAKSDSGACYPETVVQVSDRSAVETTATGADARMGQTAASSAAASVECCNCLTSDNFQSGLQAEPVGINNNNAAVDCLVTSHSNSSLQSLVELAEEAAEDCPHAEAPEPSYWSSSALLDTLVLAGPILPTVAWFLRRPGSTAAGAAGAEAGAAVGVAVGQPFYGLPTLLRGCCLLALRSLRSMPNAVIAPICLCTRPQIQQADPNNGEEEEEHGLM
ncbi:syntaphilin-like [Lethenteron reissneri]|uniref:syntaphilin-like n=1 Tax=Lethenteron reissneri TaxID=7753 RepID=UPI002AB72EF9|nr:syntaphilin-like [Lethenteron reissneri]XP_061410159.1 syntaphilin-like [Lethenteron reissneri]XP_061410160.1 syntaphilin-like [Lethenteron reissneri]XP_061410161.1 syntaphilin-like [Lethenteron reissneri]